MDKPIMTGIENDLTQFIKSHNVESMVKDKILVPHQQMFEGDFRFQKRKYHARETHNENEIIGCWCIGLEISGVNHKAKVFTISVRGYDNEPNNDEKNIKRPAIFKTEEECKTFMSELYFPDKPLRTVQITSDIYHRDVFDKSGAYLVQKPIILL